MNNAKKYLFEVDMPIDYKLLAEICNWIYEESFSEKDETIILNKLTSSDFTDNYISKKVTISYLLLIYCNSDKVWKFKDLKWRILKKLKGTKGINELFKLNNQSNDDEYFHTIEDNLKRINDLTKFNN